MCLPTVKKLCSIEKNRSLPVNLNIIKKVISDTFFRLKESPKITFANIAMDIAEKSEIATSVWNQGMIFQFSRIAKK